MKYWVVVVAKNAADHISTTIQSLLNQTILAGRIIVINDGSSDNTRHILDRYVSKCDILQVIDLPDRGFDIRRVPANINMALDSAQHVAAGYLMISGDDSTYPEDYVQTIIQKMDHDSRIVVASGHPVHLGKYTAERTPSGSGRIVRLNFLKRAGFRFPVKAGWEAWILYRAEQEGFSVRLFSDITYEHVRPRGTAHRFKYWGAAMHTLGYHPLYAFGRIGRNLIRASTGSSLGLLSGYLSALLGSSDPFILPFDKALRNYVQRTQAQEITRRVASKLRI